MGNQQSAPVYDDGHTNISKDDYTVLGELRAAEIKADIINCERIYVDKLKADKVQLCGQARVNPPPYQAFPPKREVKIDDVLNVRGTIFAGKVKCDKLNAYDVFYTQEMHYDKIDIKDRNSVNEHLVTGGGGMPHGQPPGGMGRVYMGPPAGPAPMHGGPPMHQQQQQPHFRGNFSGSAREIQLDPKCYLTAQCADVHGRHKFSAFDLNDHITNDNGQLRWVERNNTGNFSGSCRGIHLAEGGRVLACEACAVDGSWRPSHLWLDERIGNDNGNLNFV